ncbi:MAG: fluoride efflux transporter FluC [Propionibacteriaceae bacterium]
MILAMALSGGLGATFRWLVDRALMHRAPIVAATYLVNIGGSFLLGLLIRHSSASLLLLVGTGFCGGFTTFSTALVQVAAGLRDGRFLWACCHLLAMMLATSASAALAIALTS